MSIEAQLRLHRCCFTGHRPEKLDKPKEDVQAWLEYQIERAITDGYSTFISGCSMGVDIWAGQIVIRKKKEHPSIHLISAVPWPGFPARWNVMWREQYNNLLNDSDLVINVCNHYHGGVFQQRNEWMVNHSNRVIAYYNGSPGGTKNTIEYAFSKGIEIFVNDPE